ncbi:Bro-N domain-containing protein [Vibrio cholerae]|nr:hypothetical protein [Vibrio cholerae]ELI1915062.1 hypothetical protein [Vibrio cholerae]ELU8570788.1 hypothetical protein [Vibrio cholerae]GHZ39150.1 Phage antirepressor protein [Vibrio cholerae]HDL9512279.1 hypothetical protein [Vibrio cholerae]
MSEVIRAFEKVLSFEFGEQQLRTALTDEGHPMFCGKDVCQLLEVGNPSMAINRLDEDEKGIITTDTLGGLQEMIFVSESGLYKLIFTSRKPVAKDFTNWVTKEVLPQIRATGAYTLDGKSSLSARKQYIDLVKVIAKSKNEFEKEALQHALSDVSRQLGYPCTKAKVSNDKANS